MQTEIVHLKRKKLSPIPENSGRKKTNFLLFLVQTER